MVATTRTNAARSLYLRSVLACVAVLLVMTTVSIGVASGEDEQTFFDFSVDDADGNAVALRSFSHQKAILVVNVASACGYTDQNYKELQALYDKYHEQGLEILAFPCNQFGAQEPGTQAQIMQFVEEHYHVTFPVFAKVDVNGANAHPLFTFLKSKLSGFITSNIKWNFSKFLIVDGVPFKRYATTTSPFAMEQDIVQALHQQEPSGDDGARADDEL
ncbi:Glutathione peroxidase, partial [Globisporangium splendens]